MAAGAARHFETRGRGPITRPVEFDVAVVGGGAAGLWSALRAAELGAQVCLVSRTPLRESASFWAQGGLAAALEPDDSPDLHAADTIAAGRGLCRTAAVRALVEEAPAVVRDLIARGVVFDVDHEGRLGLALEGGHTHRRIVHAGGSQTGHEITSKLAVMVAAQERIEVMERTSALALWSDGERCHGVVSSAALVGAAATILATGGAAALWRRTTNPRGAIGAGPVLASLAGADLADLEFCQFHPTALAIPGTPDDGVLITEAIRGEGAKLLGADGERFTDELAPRDAVTAAILEKMRVDGKPSVDLDLREIDPARFPNVFASLAAAGLDPHREPVPVSPAAHYMMGGIAVDIDGRSSLPGLYAVGEVSCTGLHGANRLASNSLSECFVFGGRAAGAAVEEERTASRPEPPQWRFEPPSSETREAVWRYAGPMRNPDDLARLISNPYPLARALAASALRRRESRGGHLRRDLPASDPALDGIHVVVAPDGQVRDEDWH
ncbi:MAG: L-aspartate oxidase [Solirubrobacterales bacterium]